MGLTERHWFENEDVPENYEWALEDAVLGEQPEIVRCKDCRYLNEDSGICVMGIMHGYRDTWFCAYGKRR